MAESCLYARKQLPADIGSAFVFEADMGFSAFTAWNLDIKWRFNRAEKPRN
jgi:hypothetical protein